MTMFNKHVSQLCKVEQVRYIVQLDLLRRNMCVCVLLLLIVHWCSYLTSQTVNTLGLSIHLESGFRKTRFFIAQPRYFLGFYLVLLGFLDVQCQGLSM